MAVLFLLGEERLLPENNRAEHQYSDGRPFKFSLLEVQGFRSSLYYIYIYERRKKKAGIRAHPLEAVIQHWESQASQVRERGKELQRTTSTRKAIQTMILLL